jgi:hypothetical protein
MNNLDYFIFIISKKNQFIFDKDYKILLLRKEEKDFMTNNNEIVHYPNKDYKILLPKLRKQDL